MTLNCICNIGNTIKKFHFIKDTCKLYKCCVKGKMTINLRQSGNFKGRIPGVGTPSFIRQSFSPILQYHGPRKGGDGATQTNDAEVQGKGTQFAAYVSDKCRFPKKSPLSYIFRNALGPGVHRLSLEISNEFVRVRNNKGLNRHICRKCLFALDGQSEREGRINYKHLCRPKQSCICHLQKRIWNL
ncbi:hypothetical protein KUTeg_013634 [Tegillarca granosa]|uniref:Uncharacterized protein n=1 Tax=Tegillarca granosa TaxID=220873 RepID=A0ABQ9EZE2_TEGGR|nr:hypothetical protein KUTeg_013634 [Tegillarca granosa]